MPGRLELDAVGFVSWSRSNRWTCLLIWSAVGFVPGAVRVAWDLPLVCVGFDSGAALRGIRPWSPWDSSPECVGFAPFGCLARSGGKSHGAGNLAPILTCGFLNRPCGIRLWSRPTVGMTPGGRGICLWSPWDLPLVCVGLTPGAALRGNCPWGPWESTLEAVGLTPGAALRGNRPSGAWDSPLEPTCPPRAHPAPTPPRPPPRPRPRRCFVRVSCRFLY